MVISFFRPPYHIAIPFLNNLTYTLSMEKFVPAKDIEINEQFRKSLDIMEQSDKNIFITGKAGTGKSTLLEYFRSVTKKRIAVLAPTGVAALNVRGQTVHSFFKFKPDITLDKVKKISLSKQTLYKKLDSIVIDEISMVRADLLDCVEKFLRLNGRTPKALFGGIQMIFIGDLYQLPPVVTSMEKEIFKIQYDTPYFFSSRVFNDLTFTMEFVELEKIYRQKEEAFIKLLNAIRNRSVTENDIEKLNTTYSPEFVTPDEDFYICLTSTNKQAAKHNQERLQTLPGKSFAFEAFVEGEFARSSLPTEEILELKQGAQVMLVNNDRLGRWVNGSMGKIIDVKKKKSSYDKLMVELQSGEEVEVEPYMWELFQYQYDALSQKIYAEPVGSFTQYPLKLAWAITIHKSQGKTFDKVIIDIGSGTFAHGQVYVALSRCTNFNGIILIKKIKKHHIWMDYRVVKFLTKFQWEKAEKQLSYDEKYEMVLDAIRRSKDLESTYLKPDDTKTKRRIRPETIEMMEYMGKEFEGVSAFCYKRQAPRVFRIDRMLEIEVV